MNTQDKLKIPKNEFTSEKWYSLTFIDLLEEKKKIIGIRKVMDIKNMNDKAIINYLYGYFEKIDKDNAKLSNAVCQKGCCSCCSSDFEISITEFFAILQYIGVKFGNNAIDEISRKAKLSFNAANCIFVNDTDGSCTIYEVRPLICRKYGLYADSTYCEKLNGTELITTSNDTSYNTYYFKSRKTDKKIVIYPRKSVQWLTSIEGGEFKTQRMKDLFYASFNKDEDEFVDILIK